ncbi:imidazole glycerol phosphate synthase subunit HisH [Pseudidiomarina tainanensis]|uniref:Imidazole glycerol phosphate synthase subunit HisH n=1 Tax=Pseudidiomarina tainanensis TaxID=502365 RepID=A0ACD2HI97_9GAMM|nr:imidazole glycerol phosphate synthase subunit HisH [Pseudidiomarina tainanensis]RZQ56290.1 imidazole glycerol phosphate synthase subunit HisH [Pseudidiomarina tainanensis]
MITIINYGMGNLGSISNMFRYIGVESKVTSNLDEIRDAEKILLPGVGAFDAAMTKVNESGIREVLDYKTLEEKVPVLGICLGMQLLTARSDEGKLAGLGYIDAETKAFRGRIEREYRVPHMGWNVVNSNFERQCSLVDGFQNLDEVRFYFVHSYFVEVHSSENSLMTCDYGLKFDCGIIKDNIMGVQFHPEKSHKFGMRLLKNFSEM